MHATAARPGSFARQQLLPFPMAHPTPGSRWTRSEVNNPGEATWNRLREGHAQRGVGCPWDIRSGHELSKGDPF
jgi:hypothetical protein